MADNRATDQKNPELGPTQSTGCSSPQKLKKKDKTITIFPQTKAKPQLDRIQHVQKPKNYWRTKTCIQVDTNPLQKLNNLVNWLSSIYPNWDVGTLMINCFNMPHLEGLTQSIIIGTGCSLTWLLPGWVTTWKSQGCRLVWEVGKRKGQTTSELLPNKTTSAELRLQLHSCFIRDIF